MHVKTGICTILKPYLIIIIMYNYHALINALSAHMIHINLNMIFYTHVEHSPTKTIYIKYYKKTNKKHTHMRAHTDCSRNRVLILVWMEILREEEGFQFGFKRWQGRAVSKVLWEWIPNVGSKAREGAEAMCLAFVLLDFQHARGVKHKHNQEIKCALHLTVWATQPLQEIYMLIVKLI